MRKLGWLAVGAFALAGLANRANAQDVRYRITPRPAPPAPVDGASMGGPTVPAEEVPNMVPTSGPTCTPCAASAACGSSRGAHGEVTVRRLVDWLFYRPLPT